MATSIFSSALFKVTMATDDVICRLRQKFYSLVPPCAKKCADFNADILFLMQLNAQKL